MVRLECSPSFEVLRDDIGTLAASMDAARRQVRWLSSVLAYSRDSEGRLEIFIAGPPLHATIRQVRERLRHDLWNQQNLDSLEANRLVLPKGDHMDAITATILSELARNRVEQDPQSAFTQTEALINLALQAPLTQGNVITGIAGELSFLIQLIEAGLITASDVCVAWRGYAPSTRDVQLGDIGVEIKTTTTGASRHRIEGWYQVEPGVSANSTTVEARLYMLSIGIAWHHHGSPGVTVDSLIQRIIDNLGASEREEFLNAVRRYCGDSIVLDVRGQTECMAFKQPFSIGFARMYDMSDPAIEVLKSGDLAEVRNVLADTVSFQIELPKIVGSDNPISGWPAILHTLGAECS